MEKSFLQNEERYREISKHQKGRDTQRHHDTITDILFYPPDFEEMISDLFPLFFTISDVLDIFDERRKMGNSANSYAACSDNIRGSSKTASPET